MTPGAPVKLRQSAGHTRVHRWCRELALIPGTPCHAVCPRPLPCDLVAHGWQGRSRRFQGWACPCLGDHYSASHMIRKLIARVLQDLEAVCQASECQSLAQPTMLLKQEYSCLGCLLRSGRPHNWLLCQRSGLEPLEWEHWLQDPRLPEN